MPDWTVAFPRRWTGKGFSAQRWLIARHISTINAGLVKALTDMERVGLFDAEVQRRAIEAARQWVFTWNDVIDSEFQP